MKINVKYFASIREATQLSNEIFETDVKTAFDLFKIIDQKYNLQVDLTHLKVAINEEYVEFNTLLKENDTVVLIPPVAGG